ncbi:MULTISPECIES: hypothetical protein [Streptomyces]|uniref:hypothetical protein n=1 Tax=Streptomyces TaxID=1883 RepID=UPI0004CCE0C7|nr:MULTISPECIES: hypothetical protein [Streptomyces]KOT56177.1 hypothetical protein ADK43_23925 [Streptomyces rimosus subsp. rimosus]
MTAGYTPSDVEELVKKWVNQARADAKAAGERPVYFSRLSDSKRSNLFNESENWHALAAGLFLETCVQPRPTATNIRAISEHLAQCCERLLAMMDARGDDMLPEGVREQFATAEQRIGVALDIVQHAPAAWSREADAAWAELMRWAFWLTPERFTDRYHATYNRPRPWVPDGWRFYING